MPRTVIWIQETDQNKPQMFLFEPQNHPSARKGVTLNFINTQQFLDWKQGVPVDSLVQMAGDQLYQSLMSHPAIGLEFGQVAQTLHGDQHPIYFYLDPPEIDELPWETLHDAKNGFLALDARWPIARLRKPLAQIKLEYEFSPPLRVLAVLSAAGGNSTAQVPAREEWDCIYNELNAANLEFKLCVFVCEESLKQHIENLNDPKVKVDYVIDKDQLTQGILSFAPHLLHFFCHGTADQLPCLQIGTRAAWETTERDKRITLEANELRQTADPNQNVWLVTLNCCESAKQARDARTLASALVTAGFPSVVGMREPVASVHAHTFCKLFYRGVLKLINSTQVGDEPTRIEWASALWMARKTLLDSCTKGIAPTQAAPNSREWTIPVLYARGEPFLLRRGQKPKGMPLTERLHLLAKIDELKRQRDEFAARLDVDAGIRQGILNEFENEIRRIEIELKK
jgi:hypothetical protein